ncbi:DsbA family protein [Caldalkalibacillus mannanilyticus]|uniref:DsbA family protein n=1 Tax=Caldalkalibacillus mannanilyticus TaxID=1418 RepID=UPI000467FCB9|nr:DsbA family protein [Caldalkalibacillus mannanilyticus]
MSNNRSTSSVNTKLLIFITLGIIIALSAFVILNSQEEEKKNEISFDTPPPIENQPTLGDPNALVSVVEFGDYKCPACKAWSENVFPQLQKDFIDQGKISFSYINVLFHGEESTLAALASESVWKHSPESFWSFHKEVFHEQPDHINHDDLWVTPEKLVEIAQRSVPDLDIQAFKDDLAKQTFLQEVQLDQKLVDEYQIELTPSIFINGTMVENPFDYERIVELIEQGLESK